MQAGCRIAGWLCLTLLSAGASIARADEAGQKIHRCLGNAGEVVFSGLPCSASGTPATTTATPAATARPPADACITSRDALRERIGAAIAAHDANAIAGLMRWRGVDARTASGRLDQLRDLVKHPLLTIDAQGDAVADDGAVSKDEVLRVRTGSDASGTPREHAFGVDTDAQCYWLTW